MQQLQQPLYWWTGATAPAPPPDRHQPPSQSVQQASQVLPVTDPTNTGNWILNTTYSDEFNGTTLDPKWVIMSSPNNPITVGIDPVTGEGALMMTVTWAGSSSATGSLHNPSWQSGCGVTLKPYGSYTVGRSVTYGYYEARIKSNPANASSTYFLYGSDPAGTVWETEIDIEDGGGHLVNPPSASTPTVADYATQEGGVWGYPGHPNPHNGAGTFSNTGKVNPKVPNMSTAYHTFGLQWDASTITWYIDGVQTQQIKNNAPSAVGSTPPGNAFNIPMQVILDSSFFKSWYGNPIASQLPATSYYDYVRVWTKGTAKQNPVVTWATPAAIAHGTALSATQLDATDNVPGSFTYSPVLGTVLPAGASTLTASFTPTDTTTYNTATATVSLVVNPPTGKITPVITWVKPQPIIVGTGLSAQQLNATANVPGTFTYSPGIGTVLQHGPSAQVLSCTFTPTDTTTYNIATATTTIDVWKALLIS